MTSSAVTAATRSTVEFLCSAGRRRGLLSQSSASAPELLLDDTLAVVPWFCDSDVCVDLGTGGGIPGLILAAALPETRFVLVDRRQRAVDFVRYAALHLELTNVTTTQGSMDAVQEEWSVVVVRGVPSPWKLLEDAKPSQQLFYWGRSDNPNFPGWRVADSVTRPRGRGKIWRLERATPD